VRLLHENAAPETVTVVRKWVFGLWLCKTATEPLHLLAELPAEAFVALGVWKLLPAPVWQALHSAAFLTTIRVATVLCLACVLLGRLPRLSAVAACVLLTFSQAYVRSFGYINHAELPLLYAAYVLTLFQIADRRAVPEANLSGAPLTTIAALLLFTYALTASFRLSAGGLDAFRADTLIVWTLYDAHFTTYYRWTLGRDILDYPVLVEALKVGFPFVTLVELMAPLGLVSRAVRFTFLAVMIPFHLATLFLMNILFWENLALFPLLLDLDPWCRRFFGRLRAERSTSSSRAGRSANSPGGPRPPAGTGGSS